MSPLISFQPANRATIEIKTAESVFRTGSERRRLEGMSNLWQSRTWN